MQCPRYGSAVSRALRHAVTKKSMRKCKGAARGTAPLPWTADRQWGTATGWRTALSVAVVVCAVHGCMGQGGRAAQPAPRAMLPTISAVERTRLEAALDRGPASMKRWLHGVGQLSLREWANRSRTTSEENGAEEDIGETDTLEPTPVAWMLAAGNVSMQISGFLELGRIRRQESGNQTGNATEEDIALEALAAQPAIEEEGRCDTALNVQNQYAACSASLDVVSCLNNSEWYPILPPRLPEL